MAKKITVLLTLVMLIVTLAGCLTSAPNVTGNSENSINGIVKYPITLIDSYNRNIVIDKEPERIISLGPNITEIIFSLGKGKKLIGRTQYCDYPEDVKNIASVGTLREPNFEKIIALKPDVVIASTHFNKELLQKFENLHIRIAVLYGSESFDGVYETIQKAGIILNAGKEADTVINNMKEKVRGVQDKIRGKERPSVYYVVSFGKSGDFTAGSDTFIGQMIEMAGAKNSAGDVKGWKYSLEKLVEKNPEILICSKYNNSRYGIINANGYKDLKAVKTEKIHEIDDNLLDRQGTRLADGLEEMAKIIHPELYN